MADNKTANAGSGGATFVTAQGSWSGDTADLPGTFLVMASGSEGAWTFTTVPGNSGVLTAGVPRVCVATDDVNLSAIKTSVETLDNAISGSEMQVDVVGALPAGTNAIGKLAANSGVDIGDVDVTSVTPGTAASSLGKAEDAAHTTGDVGVFLLAVRSDTAAATGQTDGDYTALVTDSTGKLHVNVGNTVTVGSHAVTNAGTFAVQVDGAALTSLQLIDDSIGTIGAAAPTKAQAWGVLSGSNMEMPYAVPAATLQSDNFSFVGTYHMANASFGYVWDGSAWDRAYGDSANGADVDVTRVIPGTSATHLGKAEDAVHSSGDTGVFVLAVRSDTAASTGQTDGDYTALITDSAGKLHVNVGNTVTVGSHAVTNAGTFAVQVDGNALTALQLIDDCIFQDDAAFTPGTSKVAVIGAQADESSTDSVDEGDAGALRMTLDRKLIVTPLPHTAGGCSIFRTLDLDETEEDVKTAAGQVYGIFAINTTNATLFLKVYNATAANVTVGSTTPVMTLPVPGNNDTDGAGFWLSMPVGIAFDTAICVAATTAVADADTGAPGANALIVQVFYK